MLPVPPSDCGLSRGKTWPSGCSPGRNRSPRWPGSTRSAGSSSINRSIPPKRPSTRPSLPHPPLDDVLFYLPVTKAWLRQLVLGLVLICHSSTRGVVELLGDLFDVSDLPGDRAQHRARRRCSGSEDQPAVRPLHHPHRPPRRDLPGGRSRLGGGRCRLDLLLLAEPRRASRRRHLGHPAAGVGRPGLRSRGHHRRFRLGAPRRAPRGPAWASLPR